MLGVLLVASLINLLILVWLGAKISTQSGERLVGRVLLDSSAIIDGRILEVAQAGFLPQVMLVPRFILAELQQIADSTGNLKRARGRYGLEVVRKLQAMANVKLRVINDDPKGKSEVDDKLVAIAQKKACGIVTNDFNLNRVAGINNVPVLNVNELAHALRPILLPGERVRLKLVQRGSETNQAVGYLEDGTMVVVERSHRLIGKEVTVEVNRIMQTVAGKMLFAKLARESRHGSPPPAQ